MPDPRRPRRSAEGAARRAALSATCGIIWYRGYPRIVALLALAGLDRGDDGRHPPRLANGGGPFPGKEGMVYVAIEGRPKSGKTGASSLTRSRIRATLFCTQPEVVLVGGLFFLDILRSFPGKGPPGGRPTIFLTSAIWSWPTGWNRRFPRAGGLRSKTGRVRKKHSCARWTPWAPGFQACMGVRFELFPYLYRLEINGLWEIYPQRPIVRHF